ncbi:Ku protein [Limoniibacter endophyticus]|uniref:Non-homologous end joining protein Ku n=1 Tax=Limoniibacter endophyticus TaxID=1565040 RepID=A0A8J3GI92_9HYPH|nr:Ku protein [Limoniibacter endophyticus]GHC75575.1 non-homologous end joining protein Ku [Limoniibacter endophyticus]
MAPRANWKGTLTVAELSCPVALYTAVSQSDRISFHMLNRKTGNRLSREYIDSETEKPVEREDQVKGYETGQDDYIVLEPEEIAEAVPKSDKRLDVDAFIPCDQIDHRFFDKGYYLAPDGADALEAYALIREGMSSKNVAALAQTVLFRRLRTVLIRPHEKGLIATTLNFDYEVRPAEEIFDGIKKRKIGSEMLDLAKHIISTKAGKFNPGDFHDRYDAALAELVKAKQEGRKIRPPKQKKTADVVDLMEALRKSAGKTAPEKKTTPRRKAS